jgi:hypothetical protein
MNGGMWGFVGGVFLLKTDKCVHVSVFVFVMVVILLGSDKHLQ